MFFFCYETLVFCRCHIFERMVPGFSRPMQLLRGEVDCFERLAAYVRDGFRHVDSAFMSEVVVKS